MREAGPRPLCDQRKWLHVDLHIIRIARPRYQMDQGSLQGPFFVSGSGMPMKDEFFFAWPLIYVRVRLSVIGSESLLPKNIKKKGNQCNAR